MVTVAFILQRDLFVLTQLSLYFLKIFSLALFKMYVFFLINGVFQTAHLLFLVSFL